MRNVYAGLYPENWQQLSFEVKEAAGWRCVRCHHPFAPDTGSPLFCDSACDTSRGIHRRALHNDIRQSQHHGQRVTRIDATTIAWLGSLNYGVHHFDGDKSNDQWWNLLAMCNSCHLKTQSSVIPERPWLWEHSEWAKPYIGGFYAWWFAKQRPTRDQVEAEPELFLALGQPWLYANHAERARAYISYGFLHAEAEANRQAGIVGAII